MPSPSSRRILSRRLLASSGLLRPDLRDGLFAGALAEQADAARRAAARHLDGAAQATPLAALLHLDGQLALVDDMLHYFDRASMAHSLEVRVPFLDHRLVETCARMPDAVKVRRARRSTCCARRPRASCRTSCLSKPKLGFLGDRRGGWLAADGAAVVERTLLAPDARYAEILDRRIVEQHISDWRAGADDRSEFLLAIVMLEIWLSSYLAASFAAARGRPHAQRAA